MNKGPDNNDARLSDASLDDGAPKFGRLLLVLLAAVAFCGALTGVMAALFPDFPNF